MTKKRKGQWRRYFLFFSVTENYPWKLLDASVFTLLQRLAMRIFGLKLHFSAIQITAQGTEGASLKANKITWATTKFPSIVASAKELQRKLFQTRRYFNKQYLIIPTHRNENSTSSNIHGEIFRSRSALSARIRRFQKVPSLLTSTVHKFSKPCYFYHIFNYSHLCK